MWWGNPGSPARLSSLSSPFVSAERRREACLTVAVGTRPVTPCCPGGGLAGVSGASTSEEASWVAPSAWGFGIWGFWSPGLLPGSLGQDMEFLCHHS